MLGTQPFFALQTRNGKFLLPLDEGSGGTSRSEGLFTSRKTPSVELSKLSQEDAWEPETLAWRDSPSPFTLGILNTGIRELRLDQVVASGRRRAAHMKLFCSALCV